MISSIVLSSLLIPNFIAIRPLIIDVKIFVPILIIVTTVLQYSVLAKQSAWLLKIHS